MSLSLLGDAGRGEEVGAGTHILCRLWHSTLAATSSQGGIPPCVISKGRGQRQPGIWCLQFFSDKWHVSTERGGDGKAVVSNHSPLPAPSGRIILLYADELITVSSIWLLYKKKKMPAPLTVSTATRGPTTLQRGSITI